MESQYTAGPLYSAQMYPQNMEYSKTRNKGIDQQQRATTDAFFAIRDPEQESVMRGPVYPLKWHIDFMGSYPQMILPDNCHGNLLLLLNLLFCDDRRMDHLKPTPSRQPFCAEKLKKTLKETKLDDMEAVAPGAFKEVIRYFVSVQRKRLVGKLKVFKKSAQSAFEETGQLEEDNPVILHLARKLNLTTKKQLATVQRTVQVPGAEKNIPKATVMVLNNPKITGWFQDGLAPVIESDRLLVIKGLVDLKLDAINPSDFQLEDNSVHKRLGRALFYEADPDYVIRRYYDLLLALEAKQLKAFVADAQEREELGIAFVAQRMREIVEETELFESERDAIKFFVKLICLKLKHVANVSSYEIDPALQKESIDAVNSYVNPKIGTVGYPIVHRQLELQKYPHMMPKRLNWYFDNTVPRCVESTFATYVMMICYDFKNGGVLEKAKGSRFHDLVRRMDYETRQVSRWDFDRLLLEMLDEIKPKSCVESELEQWLRNGKRPWFVMQNKGDMMSSVAFLYNYIVFFALTNSRTDYEHHDHDPFYRDVLLSDPTIPDPLGAQGPLTAYSDMDTPIKGISQLQNLVQYINSSAKLEYKGAKGIGKLFFTVGGIVSKSNGLLPMTRAQVHFEQEIGYDEDVHQYSAYEKYTERIKTGMEKAMYISEKFKDEGIVRQFMELRLLNSHLGWNEMDSAVNRQVCEENLEKGATFLRDYLPLRTYKRPGAETRLLQAHKRKEAYYAQCVARMKMLHPQKSQDQLQKETKQQCDQGYKYALHRQCSKHAPFNRTFVKESTGHTIPQQRSSIDAYFQEAMEGSMDVQYLLEDIARDNPVACCELLQKIKKSKYGILEYNSLFVEGFDQSFYDIIAAMYGGVY